eukprot:16452346-Heterocapsa_arctica.AAC.2
MMRSSPGECPLGRRRLQSCGCNTGPAAWEGGPARGSSAKLGWAPKTGIGSSWRRYVREAGRRGSEGRGATRRPRLIGTRKVSPLCPRAMLRAKWPRGGEGRREEERERARRGEGGGQEGNGPT